MAVVRWDPFRDLATMQERMNRMFGDLYGRQSEAEPAARGDWAPPVDIYETGSELILKAELPGISREEIDVRVENNTLSVRGERRMAGDVKEDQVRRMERTYGTFSRSFSLPATIDTAKVRAEYKDGVLTVRLPVREEAKPKQIQVQVS